MTVLSRARSRKHDTDDDHEGGRGQRSSSKAFARRVRARFVLALVGIPVLTWVFRLISALSPETRSLWPWLISFIFGVGLSGIALGIGYKVAKRFPFVIWHVVATIAAATGWWSFSVAVSWEPYDRGLFWRLVDATFLPTWWWGFHILGAIFLALSWTIYTVDALRSATKTKGAGGETLEAMLGLPEGATVDRDTIVSTVDATEFEIEHEGVPMQQVRQAVPVVNELPQVIAGQTTLVREGKSGGRSKMRLPHTDPFAANQWEVWPGLSHPGGIYEAPINTARYADGSPQWYSFAKTPDGMRFAKAPDFSSPGGTFKGANGITGAGKSGDGDIENAEILSRQWTLFFYIDPVKLMQNAGWCLDIVDLAAGSPNTSAILLRGLWRVVELRGKKIQARDFSTEIAKQTGRPWIHVFMDEVDMVKQGNDFRNIATKARSTGVRFSLTVPRASGDQLDTGIRGAIGMWKQFGLSQGYDAGFAMSTDTLAAGADPQVWGSTVPGAHYLDRAPGVPEARYPMGARSYKTKEDRSDLREAVLAARQTFVPFTLDDLPDDEKEALADAMRICDPKRILLGTPIVNDQPDMQATQNLADLRKDSDDDLDDDLDEPITTGDDMLDKAIADAPDTDYSALGVNPREPIPQLPAGESGTEIPDTSGKPRFAPPQMLAEFDAALVRLTARLAAKGVREFANRDVFAEMRCAVSASWISKRFTALCEGDAITPPGLTLSRIPGKPGNYAFDRAD